MPKPARDLDWQAMAQLVGKHDDLSAMMALVPYERAENVADIQRKVSVFFRRA